MTVNKDKSTGFLGHAAIYAVGNIARRLVGFALLPIYTRYLSPADYGVIGLLTFALALFEPLFGARLGIAVPRFYFDTSDERKRRSVIWGTLSLTGAVSAVSMIWLICLRGLGSEIIFGDRRYALALGIFAVNLLSRPFEDTGMLYLRMQERSGLFLALSMIKLLLQVALNVILVVTWREGVTGVVLSGVISSSALGVALTLYIWRREAPAFDGAVIRQMLSYCWPLWFSGLAGLYVGSSGGMYLRVFGTLGDVGRLELALRFAIVVGMVIWTPFVQHWGPMSYRYFKEPDGARKFQVAFIAISVLMFAGGLGISIFSGPAIHIMAAKSFHSASAIVPILTLGFVLNNLRTFFNFSFLATDNTKASSVCQYVTAVVITVAYLALIPRYGLMGAAVAQCVAFSVGFIYTWVASRGFYDPGFHLREVATFVLISTVACFLTNVSLHFSSLMIDILVRLSVWAFSAMAIGMIGLRAIQNVDATLARQLPWPLDRLAVVAFGK